MTALISKLPIRQSTDTFLRLSELMFSKLPIRQSTDVIGRSDTAKLSKLPIRQSTISWMEVYI